MHSPGHHVLIAGRKRLLHVGDSVMTRHPRTVAPTQLAADAVNSMREHRVTALLVVDGRKLVGALNIHDLLRAGMV
jgi:arabinose-5-phosphate isomerase